MTNPISSVVSKPLPEHCDGERYHAKRKFHKKAIPDVR